MRGVVVQDPSHGIMKTRQFLSIFRCLALFRELPARWVGNTWHCFVCCVCRTPASTQLASVLHYQYCGHICTVAALCIALLGLVCAAAGVHCWFCGRWAAQVVTLWWDRQVCWKLTLAQLGQCCVLLCPVRRSLLSHWCWFIVSQGWCSQPLTAPGHKALLTTLQRMM